MQQHLPVSEISKMVVVPSNVALQKRMLKHVIGGTVSDVRIRLLERLIDADGDIIGKHGATSLFWQWNLLPAHFAPLQLLERLMDGKHYAGALRLADELDLTQRRKEAEVTAKYGRAMMRAERMSAEVRRARSRVVGRMAQETVGRYDLALRSIPGESTSVDGRQTPGHLVRMLMADGKYELALKYVYKFALQDEERFSPDQLVRACLDTDTRVLTVRTAGMLLKYVALLNLEETFPLPSLIQRFAAMGIRVHGRKGSYVVKGTRRRAAQLEDALHVLQLRVSEKEGTETGLGRWSAGLHRVLKQVHPDLDITAPAVSRLHAKLDTAAARVVADAARRSGTASMEVEHLKIAVEQVIGGELAKHGSAEGDKSVVRATESKPCELVLDVDATSALLASLLSTEPSRVAGLYLTALVEYLAAEVLELAGKAAQEQSQQPLDGGDTRPRACEVTSDHVARAIVDDEELAALFASDASGRFGSADEIEKLLAEKLEAIKSTLDPLRPCSAPSTTSPDPPTTLAADPTTAQECGLSAAITPLPEGSTWLKWGGAELEPLMEDIDVLDAKWLLMLAKGEVMPEREGVVPACQQVPTEAKVTLASLRRSRMKFLPVLVLSYGWAARAHPDPTGILLQRLVPILEALVHSCTHGIHPKSRFERPAVWGVIWDYLSLPQRGHTAGFVPDEVDAAGVTVESNDDRAPAERARFGRGLKGINIWYGHPYTTTLIVDLPMEAGVENAAPVERRGWVLCTLASNPAAPRVLTVHTMSMRLPRVCTHWQCIFERRLSSLRKHGDCCLTISRMPKVNEPYWFTIVSACQAGRYPPITPIEFETMLRRGMAREAAQEGSGYRFTNGKDATSICIPQYGEAFLRLMASGVQLAYTGCAWGGAEVGQLASSLMYAHAAGRTTRASTLRLGQNRLDDTAMPSLVEMIAAGAMPALQFLALEDMQLTDAGLEALAPLLSGPLSSLRQFGFGAGLTAAGLRTIVRALAEGHLRKLTTLYLQNNTMLADEGACILAGAIADGHLNKLAELRLSSTSMGDSGAQELASAIQRAPKLRLQTLVIGRNAFSRPSAEALQAACQERGVQLMHTAFHIFEPHKVPAHDGARRSQTHDPKRDRTVGEDSDAAADASHSEAPPVAIKRARTEGTDAKQSLEPEEELFDDEDLLDMGEGAATSAPMSMQVRVHLSRHDKPVELTHQVANSEEVLLGDALAELEKAHGLTLSNPRDSKGHAIDPCASTATAWFDHGFEAEDDTLDSDLHIWCQERESSTL